MVLERKADLPVGPQIPDVAAQVVEKKPRDPQAAHERKMFVGSILFVAAGLAVIGSWVQLESLEPTLVSPREVTEAASDSEVRPVVKRFDGSQSIKRGDLIVYDVHTAAQAQQPVVAAPNETLIVRRGQAIEGLFMMGPKSYLVSSANERKVVRAEKIRGTLSGSHTPAP
jgi:hypothetical protein